MTEQEMWWDAYLQAMHRAPDAQTHDGKREWCIVAADKALGAYHQRWPNHNMVEESLAEEMKAIEESNADLLHVASEPFDTETEEEAKQAIQMFLIKAGKYWDDTEIGCAIAASFQAFKDYYYAKER